jgi:hypothetical protein
MMGHQIPNAADCSFMPQKCENDVPMLNYNPDTHIVQWQERHVHEMVGVKPNNRMQALPFL